MTATSFALALTIGAMCQPGQVPQSAQSQPARPGYTFRAPVRMHVDGLAVRVESPGWAAPCWADVDGDGDSDLLVGQFADGKIRVYENDGEGELCPGRWLEAGGETALVPGVW